LLLNPFYPIQRINVSLVKLLKLFERTVFLCCFDLNDKKKMRSISEEVKRTVDEIVDDWLSNIEILADAGVIFLDRIGLKPDINALLSYAAGLLDSVVCCSFRSESGREMNAEDDEELIERIKRRIPELRDKLEVFLGGGGDEERNCA
jgi:hypothetical protein